MERLTEVLSMGDFTAIVWGCYAFAALVLGTSAFWSLRGLKQAKTELARLEQ